MASALEIAADVFLSINRAQFSGIIKTMKTIAYIHTDFKEKFGIPRQSGLVDARGEVHFVEPYNNPDAVRGLEGFSHIWIIWGFHQIEKDEWSPTVRPPRLGGNKRMGVFATRSPFRPNKIGMSCVELEQIEMTKDGPVLHVKGVDMLDKTPIYDIKPYVPIADCHVTAKGGFSEEKDRNVEVEFLCPIPETANKEIIEKLLKQDPRPAYKDDEERIYIMDYGRWEIQFRGSKDHIYVVKFS